MKEYNNDELKIRAYELALRTQQAEGYSINYDALIAEGLTVQNVIDQVKSSQIGFVKGETPTMTEAKKIYEWLIAD